jgi:uncharacterized OB-fold protein
MTMTAAKAIRPTITEDNNTFWAGCAEGELRVQKCKSCAHLRYPASRVCPSCLSGESEWVAVSGEGTVFSFVVFHRAYHPAREGRVPYNVSLIELKEGPILLSNVVDVDNDTLQVGQPVKVAFEKVDDDLSIPVFKRTA